MFLLLIIENQLLILIHIRKTIFDKWVPLATPQVSTLLLKFLLTFWHNFGFILPVIQINLSFGTGIYCGLFYRHELYQNLVTS